MEGNLSKNVNSLEVPHRARLRDSFGTRCHLLVGFKFPSRIIRRLLGKRPLSLGTNREHLKESRGGDDAVASYMGVPGEDPIRHPDNATNHRQREMLTDVEIRDLRSRALISALSNSVSSCWKRC